MLRNYAIASPFELNYIMKMTIMKGCSQTKLLLMQAFQGSP